MSSTSYLSEGLGLRDVPAGDVVGGGVIALLALIHLFVVGVGGSVSAVLILLVWPLVGGALAAFIESDGHPDRERELGLIGARSGAHGAVSTGVVVLITGVVGLWPSSIYTTFGSEIASVTIGVTMLFTITWAIFGYVAGYAVRELTRNR